MYQKHDSERSCVEKSVLKTDTLRKYVGIDSNAHLYESVIFTSYETAIACRTQICKAALPIILQTTRSCWLFDLVARALVPFDLLRIKPRSHVVVYLIKYKILFRKQKKLCAEDCDESAALFSKTKQWDKRFMISRSCV